MSNLLKSSAGKQWCGGLILACLVMSWFPSLACAQIERTAVQMWVLQGQDERDYLQRLESQAALLIEEVKRVIVDHPLSAEQEAKLQVAVKGTASRFKQDLSYYEALTSDFDMNNGNDQQKAAQLLAPAMQQAQQGWYGKAFLEKVVDRTLDAEQQKLLSERRRAQREQRHRALTLRMVADLDTRLSLTKDQREKLVELMNQQEITKIPPNYDTIVGHMKILRIPPKDLDAFLDQRQSEVLQKTIEPYRNIEARFP